jgi:hypothetical protein
MESVVLFDVTVDRCAPHGVWFERNGLTAVLERSTRVIVPAVAAAAVVAPPASTTSGIDAGDEVLSTSPRAASTWWASLASSVPPRSKPRSTSSARSSTRSDDYSMRTVARSTLSPITSASAICWPATTRPIHV